MNTKRRWLLIPTVLLPYIFVLAICTIIYAPDSALLASVMEKVFDNNALYVLGIIVLFVLLSIVLSLLCFVMSICKKWDERTLAKTAMIIKLIQIPAYIFIFIVGVIMVFVPMGVLFVWVGCAFDYVILLLTGLISLSAILNAVRRKMLEGKKCVWIIILQFVFVADVVATILLYLKLRGNKKEICE